jgi:diguanylate cyclase (GGDEF)-like protein
VVHAGSSVAPHVTLSIGVAQFDPDTMDTFDQLLQQADQALYRAKSLGRNRISD